MSKLPGLQARQQQLQRSGSPGPVSDVQSEDNSLTEKLRRLHIELDVAVLASGRLDAPHRARLSVHSTDYDHRPAIGFRSIRARRRTSAIWFHTPEPDHEQSAPAARGTRDRLHFGGAEVVRQPSLPGPSLRNRLQTAPSHPRSRRHSARWFPGSVWSRCRCGPSSRSWGHGGSPSGKLRRCVRG